MIVYQGGSLVANPPPINGVYSAGQEVEFCFTLTDYNQTSANWLHGIQVEWSAGWQTTTTNVVTVPPPSFRSRGLDLVSKWSRFCKWHELAIRILL